MSEREIACFDNSKAAIEEAQYCADTESKNYAIIRYGKYFGVLPRVAVLKNDVIHEVIIPTQK